MPQPIVYHSNLFSLGTLSGSHDTLTNPVRRAADGSVNLAYKAFSGGEDYIGAIQVTLPAVDRPSGLVLVRATMTSGVRFILESEEIGGGKNSTELDFTLSGEALPIYRALSGSSPERKVWRLTISGISGQDALKLYEAQLATEYQLPRSPEVRVERVRVRQFTRIPVPGGQPFVKRDGASLRQTVATYALLSGSQISGAEAFVDVVEGGEAFTLVDDRAETYWAELLGSPRFEDTAGVFMVSLGFLEISAE